MLDLDNSLSPTDQDIIVSTCGDLFLTWTKTMVTLQWRHNGRNTVSDHQPYDCLLNRLFRRRSKKTSKLRVTGLCAVNSPGTGEFPAQMASKKIYTTIHLYINGHKNELSLAGLLSEDIPLVDSCNWTGHVSCGRHYLWWYGWYGERFGWC